MCTCARVVPASDIDVNDVELEDGIGDDLAIVAWDTTHSHRHRVNRT